MNILISFQMSSERNGRTRENFSSVCSQFHAICVVRKGVHGVQVPQG